MKKRIWGGVLLGLGVPVAILETIILWMTYSSAPAGSYTGLYRIVRVVEIYGLADEILILWLALCLAFAAIPLFLAPRRKTLKLSEARGMGVIPAETLPRDSRLSHPADQGEYVLYTSLVGVEREGLCSRDAAKVLAALRPGEGLVCRSVKESGSAGGKIASELLRVSTKGGTVLGYLDAAFVRALRRRYPRHRMGLSVSRISGGDGVPYTCEVRVGVYRV